MQIDISRPSPFLADFRLRDSMMQSGKYWRQTPSVKVAWLNRG